MKGIQSAVRQDGAESVRIADTRQIPLERLQQDPDSDAIVNRVLGRLQFNSRVDIASFDSAI